MIYWRPYLAIVMWMCCGWRIWLNFSMKASCAGTSQSSGDSWLGSSCFNAFFTAAVTLEIWDKTVRISWEIEPWDSQTFCHNWYSSSQLSAWLPPLIQPAPWVELDNSFSPTCTWGIWGHCCRCPARWDHDTGHTHIGKTCQAAGALGAPAQTPKKSRPHW